MNNTLNMITTLILALVLVLAAGYGLIVVSKGLFHVAKRIHESLTYAMPNDEIISETKKCTDSGLDTMIVIKSLTYKIVGIQCKPKEINYEN